MIRTLIIDDEQLNIDLLQFEITKFCPELEIIGTALSVSDAIEAILKLKPQLVFCDIQIHDQTGFDVIDAVQDERIHFILVSAFDNYGMKAIKHSVVDYLLKPLKTQELILAVRKVVKRIQTENPATSLIEKKAQFISIPHKENIEIIKFSEIVHLEANGNYTEVHTRSNQKFLSTKTLSEYEFLLPSTHFIRIHKSHIINTHFIVKYIKSRNGGLKLSNNAEVPISLSKKKEIYDLLGI